MKSGAAGITIPMGLGVVNPSWGYAVKVPWGMVQTLLTSFVVWTGVHMHTTDYLLDEVKRRHGLPSDYKLGIVLGLSKNAVGQYRKGVSRPDDNVACRIAELLEMDAAYVVACMHAERSKEPELKTLWLSMAKRLSAPAAAAIVAFFSIAIISLANSQGVELLAFFPAAFFYGGDFHHIHCSKLLTVVSFFCTLAAVAHKTRAFRAFCTHFGAF